jgi:hypothetical protein
MGRGLETHNTCLNSRKSPSLSWRLYLGLELMSFSLPGPLSLLPYWKPFPALPLISIAGRMGLLSPRPPATEMSREISSSLGFQVTFPEFSCHLRSAQIRPLSFALLTTAGSGRGLNIFLSPIQDSLSLRSQTPNEESSCMKDFRGTGSGGWTAA